MENRKYYSKNDKNYFNKIKNDYIPMSKIYNNESVSLNFNSEEYSEEKSENQYKEELSQNETENKKNYKKDDTQLNSKTEEIIETTIVSNKKNFNSSEEEEDEENISNLNRNSTNNKKTKIVIANDYQIRISGNENDEEESESQSIKNFYENNLNTNSTNDVPSYKFVNNIKKKLNFIEEGNDYYHRKYPKKNSSTINIGEIKNKKNIAKEKFSKSKKNVDSYLQMLENSKISNSNFQKLKNSMTSDSEIESLYNMITEIKYNFKEFDISNEEDISNLSPILPLDYLSYSMRGSRKSQSINEINKKKNFLKKYIKKYRQVKQDGNTFYRIVIYRYIEILILNKNIKQFEILISNMDKCFSSKEIKQRIHIKENLYLKPKLLLKSMIIILCLLKRDEVKKAHIIFNKNINTCDTFDLGLILYFRYELYKYIKSNQNKLYSVSFPIQIGNLLPSMYEDEDGNFDFNKFYLNQLLKLFVEAEKICIYITPFVLRINLDIINYNSNDKNNVISHFNYGKEQEEEDNSVAIMDRITILNNLKEYLLVYNNTDYEQYDDIFKIYEITTGNNYYESGSESSDINENSEKSESSENSEKNENETSKSKFNKISTGKNNKKDENSNLETNYKFYKNNKERENSETEENVKTEKNNREKKNYKIEKDNRLKKNLINNNKKEKNNIIEKSKKISKDKYNKNNTKMIIKPEITDNEEENSETESITESISESEEDSDSDDNNNKKMKNVTPKKIQNNNNDHYYSKNIKRKNDIDDINLNASPINANKIISIHQKNINNKMNNNFIDNEYENNSANNYSKTETNIFSSSEKKNINIEQNNSTNEKNNKPENTQKNFISPKKAYNIIEEEIVDKNIIIRENVKNEPLEIDFSHINYDNELTNKRSNEKTNKPFFDNLSIDEGNTIIDFHKDTSQDVRSFLVDDIQEIIDLNEEKDNCNNNKSNNKIIGFTEKNCQCCQINYKTLKKNDCFLCEKCLEKELEDKIKSIFLELVDDSNNKMYSQKFNNLVEFFKKNIIKIMDKKISISKILNQLYFFKTQKKINNIKNNTEEENLKNNILENIINKVKSTICLKCKTELKENLPCYKIPCGCCFCSMNHLYFYFVENNKIQENENFTCSCLTKYTTNQLYELGDIFGKKDFWKLRTCVINNLNNLLKGECAKCAKKVKKLNKIECENDDENKEDSNNFIVIELIDELSHYLCDKCFDNCIGNSFMCNVCNRNHKVFEDTNE